ncbi:hypothetical protein HELRODRAFT_170112 [Helobdella robusta]|uniref:Uncharacterized protein n=1 Tax=Helobdella robusta TaxID=6412 RepID=T1F2N1_HELRO|nr:hypothetical protein HELRODRAFT_170112 [Helobdella robusta]ESO07566.1 hypothetical protein HELRODRAFT_170112 [Helobdella robusta]
MKKIYKLKLFEIVESLGAIHHGAVTSDFMTIAIMIIFIFFLSSQRLVADEMISDANNINNNNINNSINNNINNNININSNINNNNKWVTIMFEQRQNRVSLLVDGKKKVQEKQDVNRTFVIAETATFTCTTYTHKPDFT